MFKSKKGLTETVSFVFLTLVVVVVSFSAYFVLKDILENDIQKIDRDNMEIYLKKIDVEIDKITNIENASFSMPLTFQTGSLVLSSNQTYYQSLIAYSDSNAQCVDGLCYRGVGGYERFHFNLTGGYTFNTAITVSPGTHTLTFINNKNANQIEIRIR